jgi:Mlc titration factor MtfA (ptsG expression regulator)
MSLRLPPQGHWLVGGKLPCVREPALVSCPLLRRRARLVFFEERLLFDRLKRWQRERILRRHPVPDDLWRASLALVPMASRLSATDQARLRELVTLFLHAKRFEGAGGLVVTDPMRASVAIQACVLILELGIEAYNGWSTILVYPRSFQARGERRGPLGIVEVEGPETMGEAWSQGGPVILSWDDSHSSALHDHDGYNVIVHEFAHKIDLGDRVANGAPPLRRGVEAESWKRAFTAAYEDLRARLARGQPTGLRAYAATNPAEFFAVATESFFETPEALERAYPDVYRHLLAYYRTPRPRPADKSGPVAGSS